MRLPFFSNSVSALYISRILASVSICLSAALWHAIGPKKRTRAVSKGAKYCVSRRAADDQTLDVAKTDLDNGHLCLLLPSSSPPTRLPPFLSPST